MFDSLNKWENLWDDKRIKWHFAIILFYNVNVFHISARCLSVFIKVFSVEKTSCSSSAKCGPNDKLPAAQSRARKASEGVLKLRRL